MRIIIELFRYNFRTHYVCGDVHLYRYDNYEYVCMDVYLYKRDDYGYRPTSVHLTVSNSGGHALKSRVKGRQFFISLLK